MVVETWEKLMWQLRRESDACGYTIHLPELERDAMVGENVRA